MKDSVKTTKRGMAMEDKSTLTGTITSDTGKTIRKTDGVRKSTSKAARSRKVTGRMANTKADFE